MAEYNDSLEKIKESIKIGASPKRWICEVHRELYDLIEDHIDVDLKEHGLNLVAEAFWYGKRMSDRLKELNDVREYTPHNPNFEDDIERRARRMNLLKDIRSVNIETIDWCNRKCDWCPNKDRETSKDNLMTKDVLIRILRQLMDHVYRGQVHPFLNGEPTMDKRLPSIIKTIKAILPNNYLRVVTNGDGLRSSIAIDILFASGVDSIHMNHYTGPFKDISKARDTQYAKLTHFGLPYLKPTFNNRAGKVDFDPENKNRKCSNFLNKLAFNYKGDMILCCNDFNSEIVFGNIMESPLASILTSEKYMKYRRHHKDGTAKELPMCKDCNFIESTDN